MIVFKYIIVQLYFSVMSFYRWALNGKRVFYRIMGIYIHKNTTLSKIQFTFPRHVILSTKKIIEIGSNCTLENEIKFKFGKLKYTQETPIKIGSNVFIGNNCEFNISHRISIGDFSLIASGCKFIDHDHGRLKADKIKYQPELIKEIIIGEDVWLGNNVIVLKGVTIGNGAIVAAGAIVTKSIGAYEIWAGIPAKKIGIRE